MQNYKKKKKTQNILSYIIHSAKKRNVFLARLQVFLLPLKCLIIKEIDTFQCAKVIQIFQLRKPKQILSTGDFDNACLSTSIAIHPLE